MSDANRMGTNQRTIDNTGGTAPSTIDLGTPAASNTSAVHGAYAATAANVWTGVFTSPVIPRTLTVSFLVGWDGGNVTVHGTGPDGVDPAEVFVAVPGATAVGLKGYTTVTGATKTAVGTTGTAQIGTGDGLALPGGLALSVGVLTTDGIPDGLGPWSQLNNTVTPTLAPNGARHYRAIYEQG